MPKSCLYVTVVEQEASMIVNLEKGSGGIGFSLEGGKGSIQGDRPLVINRIFKGMHMVIITI